MKVAAVTYTDLMSGAGIAALRVHRAVRGAGTEGALHVLHRRSQDADVAALGGAWDRQANMLRRRGLRALLFALGAGRQETWSANLLRTGLRRRIDALGTDLVHLHWVGAEMLGVDDIARLATPVVWTLHDEWFSEGIAHYGAADDLPARQWGPGLHRFDRHVRARKAAAWALARPWIATPSAWLARRTLASGLADPARVRVIPNPVPLDVFRPQDRRQARERLGLPAHARIVGFGAVRADADRRKGYALLLRALEALRDRGDAQETMLLVFGMAGGGDALPLPTRFAGSTTRDEDTAALYTAMDVFVCPSMQENLPNTIAEALACGVPCAAFDVGGIPDLIAPGRHGALAAPFDPEALARAIAACLANGAAWGAEARAFAERTLAPARVAEAYLALYRDALEAGTKA